MCHQHQVEFFQKQVFDLYMPGYIQAELQKFQHSPPTR